MAIVRTTAFNSVYEVVSQKKKQLTCNLYKRKFHRDIWYHYHFGRVLCYIGSVLLFFATFSHRFLIWVLLSNRWCFRTQGNATQRNATTQAIIFNSEFQIFLEIFQLFLFLNFIIKRSLKWEPNSENFSSDFIEFEFGIVVRQSIVSAFIKLCLYLWLLYIFVGGENNTFVKSTKNATNSKSTAKHPWSQIIIAYLRSIARYGKLWIKPNKPCELVVGGYSTE